MADEELPDLKEAFKKRFFQYLQNSSEMMADGPDTQSEYKFLGFTLRRANSEHNVWNVVAKTDDGEFVLDAVNVSHYDTANNLVNELAKITGVDFEEDELEAIDDQPHSPAFR